MECTLRTSRNIHYRTPSRKLVSRSDYSRASKFNQITRKAGEPKANPKTTLEKLICAKDWDCKTAIAIAKAESGLRCNATHVNNNKSVDSGLMQINSIHKAKYEGKDIFDCKTNIEIAYQIYKASGWNAWTTYKRL